MQLGHPNTTRLSRKVKQPHPSLNIVFIVLRATTSLQSGDSETQFVIFGKVMTHSEGLP